MIDFVRRWSEAREIAVLSFVLWQGLASSKFYDWRADYGKVDEHNAWVPRDFSLGNWEKPASLEFHGRFLLERYCRLTFMMLDADVVPLNPSSVWRGLPAGAPPRGSRRARERASISRWG